MPSTRRYRTRSKPLLYLLPFFVIFTVSFSSTAYFLGQLNWTDQWGSLTHPYNAEATTSSISTAQSKPPDLLLSVPFYVYEDMAWLNATVGGIPVSQMAHRGIHNTRWKHGDDFWLLQASLRHPMRTRNMEDAKLFFVPLFLNLLDFSEKGRKLFCVEGKCGYDLLLGVQQRLRDSTAFQQYPERHVVVRSFYTATSERWNEQKSEEFVGYDKFIELLPKMNAIVFEAKDIILEDPSPKRQILSSYYVGTACDLSTEKPFDVAMISDLKSTRATFQGRRNICKWLNHSSTIRTSVCGAGSRCPALAQSKFGFHSAGDTWGSQRLMDTISSGTVPIFTHLDQYGIQGSWIDWNQLSYYLPVHNDADETKRTVSKYSLRPPSTEDSFLKGLEAIVNDKEGYEKRHQKVMEHRPLFDYSTLYPFDTYMYLFQAGLFPETRIRESKWSALLLPPPLFTSP